MSPENVELVRQGFADEFDRRFDDANLDEFFDPIEWVPVQQSLLARSEDRGYEGVRRFWIESLSTSHEYSIDPEEVSGRRAGGGPAAPTRRRGAER
jgi:hypothetical protein